MHDVGGPSFKPNSSLLENFIRGNLEAHDDLSCVSLGNINLYNSIAFDHLGSQVLLSSPKNHCEGISPLLYPTHSAMWWLPSATSYPQFKSPETKDDVSGTNHHLTHPHRQGVQRHWLQAGCSIHTRGRNGISSPGRQRFEENNIQTRNGNANLVPSNVVIYSKGLWRDGESICRQSSATRKKSLSLRAQLHPHCKRWEKKKKKGTMG